MKPISYESYRADTLMRERLDRDVRRARSKAFARFLVRPLKALYRRLSRTRGRVLVVRTLTARST